MLDTKHIFSVIFLIVVSGVCYSQQWILRLKPMIGSPVMSFQHFEKVVYDPGVNYSNGPKPVAASFAGNVELRGAPNLELAAEVYEWKQWRFGAGIGVYGGSRVFLKVESSQQDSKYINNNEIITGNSTDANSYSIGPVDFNTFALATRSLNSRLNGTEQLHHFVSIGAGFTKNKKNGQQDDVFPYGSRAYVPSTSHNYFPFLLLRYEVEFLNKRGQNLFNLVASYQQGIFQVATLTWTDTYDAGAYYSMSAHTRGSSISLGISKPFYLKRPANR